MSAAATTINPEQIRKELSELWVSLAQEGETKAGEAKAGVLRACTMTLIAAVSERDDSNQISETLAMLMREHPSRAIVVRVRDSQEQFLDSRVFAQCWMPFGDRRQICCEQVEITASCASLSDLPAVILPLAVADLPVVLWSRSPLALEMLGGIAGKLIVDGEILKDVEKVRSLAGRHRVADLAWTRLTRWRELVAQIFENRCYLEDLPSLTTLRMTYEGERPTVSAFYLAAWMNREHTIWERGAHSSMTLETAAGQVHTSIKTTEDSGMEVSVRGKVTHTVFPPVTDYTLLREELSIPDRDTVFDSTLPRAAQMSAAFEEKAA